MPRTSVFELVTDTSHFNPLQLQPRTLLSSSFNALAVWLREHWVSFPELIGTHHCSVVILGVTLQYEAPLQFLEADHLRVESTLRVIRAGSRAELDVRFHAPRGCVAHVRILLCPVHIEDPVSLGAVPASFPRELLERLRPDEIEASSPTRDLPELLARIESTATRLGTHRHDFVVHRHMCEVADQWAFFEVPALVGASREAFAHSTAGKVLQLRDAIAKPLSQFTMELQRPYFWFDEGVVETTAYRWRDQLVLKHLLLSSQPGGEVHGTVIERL